VVDCIKKVNVEIVPKAVKLIAKSINREFPVPTTGAEEVRNLLYKHRDRAQSLRKPNHLENQCASRVIQAATLPDLAERLTGRAAVQERQRTRLQFKHVTQPIGIHGPYVYLPDGLPTGVASECRHAVCIVLDGADGLESGPVNSDVYPASTGEETDGKRLATQW